MVGDVVEAGHVDPGGQAQGCGRHEPGRDSENGVQHRRKRAAGPPIVRPRQRQQKRNHDGVGELYADGRTDARAGSRIGCEAGALRPEPLDREQCEQAKQHGEVVVPGRFDRLL